MAPQSLFLGSELAQARQLTQEEIDSVYREVATEKERMRREVEGRVAECLQKQEEEKVAAIERLNAAISADLARVLEESECNEAVDVARLNQEIAEFKEKIALNELNYAEQINSLREAEEELARREAILSENFSQSIERAKLAAIGQLRDAQNLVSDALGRAKCFLAGVMASEELAEFLAENGEALSEVLIRMLLLEFLGGDFEEELSEDELASRIKEFFPDSDEEDFPGSVERDSDSDAGRRVSSNGGATSFAGGARGLDGGGTISDEEGLPSFSCKADVAAFVRAHREVVAFDDPLIKSAFLRILFNLKKVSSENFNFKDASVLSSVVKKLVDASFLACFELPELVDDACSCRTRSATRGGAEFYEFARARRENAEKSRLRSAELEKRLSEASQVSGVDGFLSARSVFDEDEPSDFVAPAQGEAVSVADLERSSDLRRYAPDVRYVLERLEKESSPSGRPTFAFTEQVCDVCKKIFTSYEVKSAKGHAMKPYPVQVLAILRLLEGILSEGSFTKGAVAEIKTGEGKSFVIAVVSIVLALQGRKIDIVTSTSDLAVRDQLEQKVYYDLFGIGSAVLLDKESEGELLEMTASPFVGGKKFTTECFLQPIVYSTNANLQFVYMFSLLSKESLRGNRAHDVVIVDEVDNMLLDQAGNPAILSQKFKIAEYEGIFRLIYQLQDRSTLELQKIIKCTWANYPVLDVAVIDFLKKAAHAARWHQRDRDYIVIDKCGKPEVVIMDSTTGSAKYGSRWSDFVHEMVEIKEGLAIREPGVSYFAITQNDFFNLYRTIAGVTGTLGDGTDALLLRTTYQVKIFSVPTNKPCLRVVSHVNGQPTPKKLKREILEQVQKNRPVLVIFEDIKTLKEFNRSIDCRQVIQGVSPKADELAVRCAGLFRMVTFATNAAGRGMDIKPTRGVLSAGGLHVII